MKRDRLGGKGRRNIEAVSAAECHVRESAGEKGREGEIEEKPVKAPTPATAAAWRRPTATTGRSAGSPSGTRTEILWKKAKFSCSL